MSRLQLLAHLRSFLIFLGMTSVITIIAANIAMYRYGSLGNALAALNGVRVIIRQPVQVLGQVNIGESRSLKYEVTNLTGHPLTVLGLAASCKCTKVVSELTTFPAIKPVVVTITYTPIEEQVGHDYRGKVKYSVNDPLVRQVELIFQARVLAAPEVSQR